MEKSNASNWSWLHLGAVFVLTFWVASAFMSMAMPKASRLHSNGHPDVALYFNVFSVALWFIALFVLLPRRRNTSGIGIVRALGRFPLLLRFFLLILLATGFFWLGILFERIGG
ncbi:MAG TPA: hypothetical protein VK530_04600 [Candidatus Acidoferrum sp.]|nr:hypothetical protein [Candidatus Acidoferrum sp.]